MISVEEARARILDGLAPLPAEIVGLDFGLGRVLAEPVAARLTHPPADQSAMDGYAVRAADAAEPGTSLAVIGSIAAGGLPDRPLGPGECVRLFTGAPLPAGADAVVIQEDAQRDGDRVSFAVGAVAGRHVRPKGQDFRTGQMLLGAGVRLGARHLALAAAGGNPWLAVHRRPRVAFLATGDELVMPGEPVAPGRIVSSNSIMLPALVREAGGIAIRLGIAADRRDRLDALLASAGSVDLVVTCGGASVGEHDLVRDAVTSVGGTLDFWKIAMRPGMPLIAGRLGGARFIGLPGNPVSAFTCALLFLVPALKRLQGLDPAPPPPVPAVLAAPVEATGPRETYLRAHLVASAGEDLPVVMPVASQDSGMLRMLASADGLIQRLPHAPPEGPGAVVRFIPFAGSLPYHDDA